VICVLGLALHGDVHELEKAAGPSRHARDLGADLETCKTYLITQGKFILILEAFIAVVIILYFGVLSRMSRARGDHSWLQFGWYCRQLRLPGLAFALIPSLTRALLTPVSRAKPFPLYAIPLKAGMKH